MRNERSSFFERIKKIESKLSEIGTDALLFFDIKNIRYLSGFSGSDGILLIGDGKRMLLVDGRYTHQAKREAEDIEIFEYKEKVEGVRTVLSDYGFKTVGFESAALDVYTYLNLKANIENVAFKPIYEEITLLRAVKDEEEIARIKKAALISYKSISSTRERIKPGVKEKDIALELEFWMGKYGAEQASFPTIVASGPNSAMPHARAGSRVLEVGDVVVIDFGSVYQGYRCDETWTSVLGNPNDEQKDVFALVKKAQDAAINTIKPGVLCREVDHAARSFIDKKEMGNFFPHGTGHGVGIDVHEAPRIAPSSRHILEAGMVITIEPGIYIPGLWGIRIEETVLVTESGAEVLTKTPKDFKASYQ